MGQLASTVFVIDDDEAARQSLCVLLETSEYFVEGYSTAKGFLRNYNALTNGCVLLDLYMPGMSGLELQQILNSEANRLPVIFVSGKGNVAKSVQAMKEGAFDFLEKPYRREVLLKCIADALTHRAQSLEVDLQREELKARFADLTRREREVLLHLVDGDTSVSSRQIAELLHISRRTVEHHRSSIMAKMRARSVLELVNIARLCNFPFVKT
ncbi:MAG: response regulator transcription factor [Gammaproteobacteria bacterium]